MGEKKKWIYFGITLGTLFLRSVYGSEKVEVNFGVFIADNRQVIFFSAENNNNFEIACKSVSANVIYEDSGSRQELGMRRVSLSNFSITARQTHFQKEAGKDVIERLKAQYPNASIKEVERGSLTYNCRQVNLDDQRKTDALKEEKVGISARFVPIQSTDYQMGSLHSEEGRHSNEVRHRVKMTKKFEIQSTPVTQYQWQIVMGNNPSYYQREENCDPGNYKIISGVPMCKNHPVENVSWESVNLFINELNRIQYDFTYRLPTEAEWEFASRGNAAENAPYFFGVNKNDLLGKYSWYLDNSKWRSHSVASKLPNSYQLFDVLGNVWEWALNWYVENPVDEEVNPVGPSAGTHHAIRGGSSFGDALDCRLARRSRANKASHDIGFRLVREN